MTTTMSDIMTTTMLEIACCIGLFIMSVLHAANGDIAWEIFDLFWIYIVMKKW